MTFCGGFKIHLQIFAASQLRGSLCPLPLNLGTGLCDGFKETEHSGSDLHELRDSSFCQPLLGHLPLEP